MQTRYRQIRRQRVEAALRSQRRQPGVDRLAPRVDSGVLVAELSPTGPAVPGSNEPATRRR